MDIEHCLFYNFKWQKTISWLTCGSLQELTLPIAACSRGCRSYSTYRFTKYHRNLLSTGTDASPMIWTTWTASRSITGVTSCYAAMARHKARDSPCTPLRRRAPGELSSFQTRRMWPDILTVSIPATGGCRGEPSGASKSVGTKTSVTRLRLAIPQEVSIY